MNYTIWMTGLSGSGKSTLAQMCKEKDPDLVILDGDALRGGLCSDLGFSIDDRRENMRRLRALCKLFNDNGKNVITAFISPIEEERRKAQLEIPNCHVVWCDSPLEVCERRDVKGLYKKARAGKIPEFTGISSPFEEPKCADVLLDTGRLPAEKCLSRLIRFIQVVNQAPEAAEWANASSKETHLTFVGRWCPLHRGHTWIIEEKVEKEQLPALILVRDTAYDEFPAKVRCELVKRWMITKKIRGTIMIIPDIVGVYWGRGVGYQTQEVEPPDDIKAISATKIRELIAKNDASWKEIVAPGTADYLEEILGK